MKKETDFCPINICHYWNESLLNKVVIQDTIRPSERRNSYATEIVRIALIECRKLEIERALMTSDKDNIGFAKSIIKNGGQQKQS